MMKKIYLVLVHISTILAMVFVTYFILDQYNPLMKFLDNQTSKILLLIFAIITLVINQAAIVQCINHDSDEENELIRKKREARRRKRTQNRRRGGTDSTTATTEAVATTKIKRTGNSNPGMELNTKGLREDEIENL